MYQHSLISDHMDNVDLLFKNEWKRKWNQNLESKTFGVRCKYFKSSQGTAVQ